jgi:hypothetical protein
VRTDGRFPLTAEANVTSGRCLPAPAPRNVWSVDLAAAGTPLPAFVTAPDWLLSLLFSDDGGRSPQRAIRARFPNGDPETVQWPEGWASGGAWTAPTPDENTTVIHVPFPRNYGPGMFTDYWLGVGGPCVVYQESDNNEGTGPVESAGYWCQPNGRTGGGLYFSRQPSALTLGAADLPNAPYALPAGEWGVAGAPGANLGGINAAHRPLQLRAGRRRGCRRLRRLRRRRARRRQRRKRSEWSGPAAYKTPMAHPHLQPPAALP